jgi:hypothetical protein
MKTNYVCANLDCQYTTNRDDNLKIRDLNQFVKEQGGEISEVSQMCPECKQNTLVLELN